MTHQVNPVNHVNPVHPEPFSPPSSLAPLPHGTDPDNYKSREGLRSTVTNCRRHLTKLRNRAGFVPSSRAREFSDLIRLLRESQQALDNDWTKERATQEVA